MEKLPSIAHLPKDHYARNQVAQQLREARQYDRLNLWNTTRTYDDYVQILDGITLLLEYTASLTQRHIIDIGTGTGRALEDIAKLHRNLGLHYTGTTLAALPNSSVPIKSTSIEVMRGYGANSVSGILSVHSLNYCMHPTYAVARIDEILEPGGVIKVAGLGIEARLPSNYPSTLGSVRLYSVAEIFQSLGYDVSYFCHVNQTGRNIEDRMLAKKPGGNECITADFLMKGEQEVSAQLNRQLL